VFRPEHIIAVAASVGRHKDLARIEQLLQQTQIDKTLLDDIHHQTPVRQIWQQSRVWSPVF
jgi:hypothetical protein